MQIKIDPKGKPRITSKGKFSPRAKKYYVYAEELRLRSRLSGKLADRFKLTFVIPMPKSWSEAKKQKMNGMGHQQTPDGDNLEKSFLDALCVNDSYIYEVHRKKVWGYVGFIEYEAL